MHWWLGENNRNTSSDCVKAALDHLATMQVLGRHRQADGQVIYRREKANGQIH